MSNWLTRADHDLRSARALAALADPLLDTAIYHCQQAGEKAPKAWLQSRDEPFAKTHDLVSLVSQASQSLGAFRDFEQAAALLTPYVSAFRYPGGTFEQMPTPGEYDAALKHAEAIYSFVCQQLAAGPRLAAEPPRAAAAIVPPDQSARLAGDAT